MADNFSFRERLLAELPLSRPISIVDIGASNLYSKYKAPYENLLEKGYATLYGFEPNPEEFKKLESDERRVYLPYAIGDGSYKELNVYKTAGLTSMLKPSREAFHIERMRDRFDHIETIGFETKRLDDIEEISNVDFLKIDIQGGEVEVFKSGPKKLSKSLLVRSEMAFVPLYENQPLFGDQDQVLRSLGLYFFEFVEVAKFGYSYMWRPFWPPRKRLRDPMQWVDSDAHYVRDFSTWPEMDKDELVRLIYLSIFSLKSRHMLGQLIEIMNRRGFLGKTWTVQYRRTLKHGDPLI